MSADKVIGQSADNRLRALLYEVLTLATVAPNRSRNGLQLRPSAHFVELVVHCPSRFAFLS
jgi:hypothetical protein